jgi:hypothetical protein
VSPGSSASSSNLIRADDARRADNTHDARSADNTHDAGNPSYPCSHGWSDNTCFDSLSFDPGGCTCVLRLACGHFERR